MAGLIAALAVMGAAMLLVIPDNATEPGHTRSISVNYYLLPAVAVSGTVALLELFVIVAATSRDKTDEGALKESANQPREMKSHRRRKKEEVEAPLPAPKSRARGKNKAQAGTAEEAVPKTQNVS